MQYVIGVDSGGSKTRAMAVELNGLPVGYGETAGGNPFHNPDFKSALSGAIKGAAEGVGIENVVCCICGIAGLNRPTDLEWAREATTVEGLVGERIHVNDAEVAHFGAFSGSFGVISIQGHGSNIFAVTEDGSKVLNSDFMHYASAGAVSLAMDFHFAVIRGCDNPNEDSLVRELCRHWNVPSLEVLHLLGRRGWDLDREKARNHMATFAPQITAAAAGGSDLALSICRRAAASIAEGIGLVGQCFQGSTVPVVLSGSTVQSRIMEALVTGFLDESTTKQYSIRKPDNSPLVGAVLMALKRHGMKLDRIDSQLLDTFHGG